MHKKVHGRRALRNILWTASILLVAVALCTLLSRVHNDNNPFAVPLFLLSVAVIARVTDGYLYGVCASVVSVFCVNYMFSYPFWEFSFSVTGYPLTFAVMLVVSIIISALTTQIKRQEQLRFDAETERMRANLLRSISHDLRTPLSSIAGASSAMLENESMSASERRELLGEVNRSANWLIRVMENILSVTRCADGAVHLRKESEAIEEIVSSAIVKFGRKHPEYRIDVRRPDEILFAQMDATLIEQVLLNLFENVAAHAQTATRIDVAVFRSEGMAYVSVSDDGVGFSSAVLPKLFGGLNPAREGTADSHRNMGIGLSVCRSILRAHDGDIRIKKSASGGCVEFYLPCEEESENEQ